MNIGNMTIKELSKRVKEIEKTYKIISKKERRIQNASFARLKLAYVQRGQAYKELNLDPGEIGAFLNGVLDTRDDKHE